jgi:hypothetical protein
MGGTQETCRVVNRPAQHSAADSETDSKHDNQTDNQIFSARFMPFRQSFVAERLQ